MVYRLALLLILLVAVCVDGFIAIKHFDLNYSGLTWCEGGKDACFREWVSALSGWAAAIIGGLTLYALYQQIAEQRRQSAFVLGDALPTMDATFPTKSGEDIVLRIVNWNRRSCLVNDLRVKIDGERANWRIEDIHSDEEKFPPPFSSLLDRKVLIRGWINRQAAPSTGKIFLDVAPFMATWIDDTTIVNISFEVDVRIVGETHKVEPLQASITVLTGQITASDWQ